MTQISGDDTRFNTPLLGRLAVRFTGFRAIKVQNRAAADGISHPKHLCQNTRAHMDHAGSSRGLDETHVRFRGGGLNQSLASQNIPPLKLSLAE